MFISIYKNNWKGRFSTIKHCCIYLSIGYDYQQRSPWVFSMLHTIQVWNKSLEMKNIASFGKIMFRLVSSMLPFNLYLWPFNSFVGGGNRYYSSHFLALHSVRKALCLHSGPDICIKYYYGWNKKLGSTALSFIERWFGISNVILSDSTCWSNFILTLCLPLWNKLCVGY